MWIRSSYSISPLFVRIGELSPTMTDFNDQFRVTNTSVDTVIGNQFANRFESVFKLPQWNSRVSIDSGHCEAFTFIVFVKFYRFLSIVDTRWLYNGEADLKIWLLIFLLFSWYGKIEINESITCHDTIDSTKRIQFWIFSISNHQRWCFVCLECLFLD